MRAPTEYVLSPHMRTEADSTSETVSSLIIRNSGRWTESVNPGILSGIDHRQSPTGST
jgi:hypothetical protein